MCDPGHVAKMIQVRHVRPEVHAELMRRAKASKMTLTSYVEQILEREVAREQLEDVMARIKARRVLLPRGGPSAAETVREVRREMEEEWARKHAAASSTRRRSSRSS